MPHNANSNRSSKGSKTQRDNVKDTRRPTASVKAAKKVTEHQAPPAMSLIEPVITHDLQQMLLKIFSEAFASSFNDALLPSIQIVKHHLFNRDFEKAFNSHANAEIYAMRWSPSRALAYLDIITGYSEIGECIQDPTTASEFLNRESDRHGKREETLTIQAQSGDPQNPKVVCIGGGAGAEVVALAGYLRYLDIEAQPSSIGNATHNHKTISGVTAPLNLAVTVIDIADWSKVLHDLSSKITSPPQLPKYASTATKATNQPIVDQEKLSVTFNQSDVLNMDMYAMATALKDASIVTLMFTLNELYSTSLKGTTNFLLSLSYILDPGSLLLVVDSPGSYSTVSLGTGAQGTSQGESSKEVRYPMQRLLEHTLLQASTIGSSQNTSAGGKWERLHSDDSKWFRLSERLRYPIDLEDMRYQVHLYKHL